MSWAAPTATDHRLGWSHAPAGVVIFGDILIVLAYIGFYLVFRENTYGAATVQVAEGQKVVSTGPYAVVRHPMYGWALLMMLGLPLALGSWCTQTGTPAGCVRAYSSCCPASQELWRGCLMKSNSLLGTSQGTRTTCAKFVIGWFLLCGEADPVLHVHSRARTMNETKARFRQSGTVLPKFASCQNTQLVAGFRTQCYSAAKPAAVGPRSGMVPGAI